MRSTRSLLGIRVAVLATDGFETVALIQPMKRLRKEGADARVVSVRPGRIQGMNFLRRGRKVDVDQTLAVTRASEFDALLLPGGFVNPDFLRQSPRVLQLVREFDRAGKPIAALGHAPWVLISAGLVHGRRLTSWTGIADDVRHAGGVWLDQAVVRERNWLTSRSPLDLRAFNDAMVALYAELAPRRAIMPGRPALETAAGLLLTASALTTAALWARKRLAA